MKYTTVAGILLFVLFLSACSSNVTPDTQNTLEAQAGSWGLNIGFFTDSSPNGSTTVATDGTNIFTAYPTYNASSNCLDIRVKKWSGSSWTNVGNDLNGSSEAGAFGDCHAYYPSLALDPSSGNPVVAWLELAGSVTNVYVQRFNGTSWENLTPSGFPANNTQFYPSLVLDSSGYPIVAWRKGYGIYVDRFNGISWDNLVSDLRTPDGFANNPALAIDPSDNPVLAWDSINNFGTVTNIYVQRYNGSSWEDVGGPLSWSYPNGGWSRPSIAVDSTGNPTIAWDSYDGSVLNIYVRRFDASTNTWVNVGSGVLSASSADSDPRFPSHAQSPSLVLDSSGNPIVAWQEYLRSGGFWNIYVYRFTGSAWVNVGSTPDTPVDPTLATSYGSPSLALSSTGNLAVAYEGGGWVHVSRYVTTLPGIVINVSPEPNAAGWNNSDVTVTFSSTTTGATCTPSVTVSEETSESGQVVSGTCTDSAGDSSTTSVTIKLDKTAPTVSVVGVTEGETYHAQPEVTCSSTDALSGIATEAEPSITENEDGSFTATCTNTDRAGNGSSDSVKYTVTTTPVDTTPPVITANANPPANSNGWNNSDVTVSYTCTDAASGVNTSASSLTDDVLSSSGTAEGVCVDQAGNSATATYTAKIDKVKPVITGTAPSGWSNSDVTISFSCSDEANGSGVDATNTNLPNATVTGEGNNLSASSTGQCLDNAGNQAAPVTLSGIKIDRTAPNVTASASPAPNANGWNNSDVTVSFSGTDNLSGVAGCSSNLIVSTNGAGQTQSGTCTDNAGNLGSASLSVSLDKTAPAVNVTGVTNGATYSVGSVPTAACNTTDALSGVATSATISLSGGSNPPTSTGSYTATCSAATDRAGNAAANINVTFTVTSGSPSFNFSGFFSPVDNPPTFNTVAAGRSIPIKFSLGGDYGLNILASGSPSSRVVPCSSSSPTDGIEETTTSNSGLSYDPASGQYTYVWKTSKSWTGCREFTLRLSDGSEYKALFKF